MKIDFEERRKASRQANHERDTLIRGVFDDYRDRIDIVFDRSVPIGHDAKYDIRDKQTGEMFIIHDRRTIPCGPSLAVSIRQQLEAHGIMYKRT